jgi:hypothetical protein
MRLSKGEWDRIFAKIPRGMALVIGGKTAETAYQAFRRGKRKGEFRHLRSVGRRKVLYIVYSEEKEALEK